MDALNANAGLTGFGLLIAAIIKWTLTHIRLGTISQITTLGAFLAWSIYVWADAVTFGSAPECNGKIKIYLTVSLRLRDCPMGAEGLGQSLARRDGGPRGTGHHCADPGSSPGVAISSTVMLQLLVLSLVMIVAILREVLNFLIDRVRRRVGDLGDDSRSSIDFDPELHMMRRVSYTECQTFDRSSHDLHYYRSSSLLRKYLAAQKVVARPAIPQTDRKKVLNSLATRLKSQRSDNLRDTAAEEEPDILFARLAAFKTFALRLAFTLFRA
ncbi:hypothetical protein EDB92DRAFT_1817599 [Lactarius akahatsu]|uniref:Uncharacterized protein n=1 Tax=Lactarius akahatsu TaxID=416441 RepID=A0AAD4LE98_9AGAM|nr:hypothetical protein EDB92DRAFT_1817599 [Lactarius akahatsu]